MSLGDGLATSLLAWPWSSIGTVLAAERALRRRLKVKFLYGSGKKLMCHYKM